MGLSGRIVEGKADRICALDELVVGFVTANWRECQTGMGQPGTKIHPWLGIDWDYSSVSILKSGPKAGLI